MWPTGDTNQGTVECGEDKITEGESSGTETLSQLASIKYGACEAFGLSENDISPAHLIFLASGEVHLTKLIKILSLFTDCEISIPPQLLNKVDYRINGHNILLESLVSGIHYTANSSCLSSGSFTDGTFTGKVEIMIPNGQLSFMP